MTRDFIGLLIVLTIIGGFVAAYPHIRYEPGAAVADVPTSDEAADHLVEAMKGRPDRASVKPVGEQRRRESEAPDPTEIIMAPETGIGLGWGWNAFHGEAIPTQCVEFTRAQPFKGQTASLDFSEVNDQFELQTALDMSASTSVKAAGYDVEGEAKFSSETQINGSALTYVIEAEVLNAPWVAQPAGDGGGQAVRLTPSAERLAARDIELFKDVCGTGYISATYGGAKLSIVVEITTSSQSTRQAMAASVKGGGWGVKVNAAMSGSSETNNSRASRDIHFFQSGGAPEVLPTTPAEIIAATTRLAGQAATAEKIFRIAITPYEVLRNWPREDNLSGADLEYEELAALWGSYQALYDGLQDALDAPENYLLPYHHCDDTGCHTAFLTAAADDIEAEIKALQDEVIIWLDRLELAARACVTAEEDCDTNAALYRTPYAYQVTLPVRTCMFDPDFSTEDATKYEAARGAIYKATYGEPILRRAEGAKPEADRPVIEDFFPVIERDCAAPDPEVPSASAKAFDTFAELMIEDTAKGRCALGSLTPGCLDNSDIADWVARIGQRAIILSSDTEVSTLKQRVIRALNAEDNAWTEACAYLKDRANWIVGDPGTSLNTSVWVAPLCEAEIRKIAANL